MSNASTDSHLGDLGMSRRGGPSMHLPGRPATAGGPSASTSNLQNFSRPTPQTPHDSSMRVQSPPVTSAQFSHRAKQHSQGFFEPSLAHASSTNPTTPNTLTASQIAAQAAMHHVQVGHQERKRSAGSLAPINTSASAHAGRRVPSPIAITSIPTSNNAHQLPYANGTVGGRHLAAATAANAAFPRSPLPSPNSHASDHHAPPSNPPPSPLPPAQNPLPMAAPPAPEPKPKERSKMKLFSKPKNIGIPKESEKKYPNLPSPSRSLLRAGFANASTTSLVDPMASAGPSSIYSSANASTSTLMPSAMNPTGDKDKDRDKEKEKEKDKDKEKEKEKEKGYRHHFLSRQKQKLKESAEHRNLPLSSASSNSQAVDPSAPSSLYSFAPASPGFSKSVSGLDLRHGGRALREKKKEEKAAAAASSSLTPIMSNSSANLSKYDDSRSEFVGPSSYDSSSILGPPTGLTTSSSMFSFQTAEQTPTMSAAAFNNLGTTMGLTGITPDDAWPLLKARLLNIFEGEDLRTPIEDFNLLVSVHIRRCVQKRAPIVLIDDLRELLFTGFSSVAQTLRGIPDERLVPKLVETWITVFGTILPFIQAVFLPLDLEFKGHGAIMSAREASEFWALFMPDDSGSSKVDERPASSGGAVKLPTLGEELDVRRITLISFRDVVVLPKHESLMAIFSRLSLDSIKTSPSPAATSAPQDFRTAAPRSRGLSNPATTGAERPGTGGSLSPRLSSFNSQTSTLLDAASTTSSSGGGGFSFNQTTSHSRSRATSNTSAGSFGTSLPHMPSPLSQPPMPIPESSLSFQQRLSQQQLSLPVPIADPAQVTQTVARMLQCVSVLAGVQTGDQGQSVVERLTQALKYNWLGRGRTGRQRRGWVGMKVGTGAAGAAAAAAAATIGGVTNGLPGKAAGVLAGA